MSKTLLRGLDLIEVVGLHGPMTITELARRTGIDVTIVSRTVSACEPDGWLARVDGKIVAGPRCALLGLTSPASHAIRLAEPLVHAIAGATGVATIASGLVGHDVMVLASAIGSGPPLTVGISSRVPIHVMASGRAIAIQLPAEQLTKLLPSEPYADADSVIDSLHTASSVPAFLASYQHAGSGTSGVPRTRVELEADLSRSRTRGFAVDSGEVHPSIFCIAAPWPTAGLPASIACIGNRDEITAQMHLIEDCLRTATQPGATTHDIILTAAAAPATR
jgi:DNA-binding IclR family transcriptional regulator